MSNCDNSLQWLYDWEYNSDGLKNYQDLPLYIENCFKKKTEPYTLYRGLKWNQSDVVEYMQKHNVSFDFHKYNKDQILVLNLRDLTSWSTKQSIANVFSENKDYGIILQAFIKQSSVLVDLDMSFNDKRLGEVILLPGTYKCKVIKVVKNVEIQTGKITYI